MASHTHFGPRSGSPSFATASSSGVRLICGCTQLRGVQFGGARVAAGKKEVRCQDSRNGRAGEEGGRASTAGLMAALPSLLACSAAAGRGVDEHVPVDGGSLVALDGILRGIPVAALDPDTAQLCINILGPLLASLNFLFILRIVMSWYPALPVGRFPFVIAYAPTEPVLEPTRRLIRPVGGVDVSPIVWVALMSFLNEILLGQQGLLVLLSQERV